MTSVSYTSEKVENGLYDVKSFNSLPEKEISLIEAYNLGLSQGKKFDKKAILLFFNSVDDGIISGRNGKKMNWQGAFSLPTVNHNMVVIIEKGKLKRYRIIDSSEEFTIPDSEIKIDSTNIVNSAIEKFKLLPRDDSFSHGYHFRLVRDEKYIFLGVDGKINNQNAEIFYNPKNGEYLGDVMTPKNN
ncbi:hypothetical protein [Rummeliibacillus pycnus]|uniref:hypothetical protein n=1 Tax=Rummeliibacillus pycnus TaxID=101070 RepID=UPI003D2DA9CF